MARAGSPAPSREEGAGGRARLPRGCGAEALGRRPPRAAGEGGEAGPERQPSLGLPFTPVPAAPFGLGRREPSESSGLASADPAAVNGKMKGLFICRYTSPQPPGPSASLAQFQGLFLFSKSFELYSVME